MELRDFITHIHSNDQWQLSPIVCFTGQSYPILFFSQLRSYFKIKKNYSILTLLPDKNIQINLSMSLVTETPLYWLSSLEELSKKEQKELCTFLGTYSGPHRIVLFIPEELSTCINSRWTLIKIPEYCDKLLFSVLADWFSAEAKNKRETALLTPALFKQKNNFSLDDACLLLYYQAVIGKNISSFVSQCLPQLVSPSTSLFALSQSLFSHDATTFWKQWQQVAMQFSPQFWIAFWSEQLWRATNYIALQRGKQNREAKIMSAKLPFSFVQRDWHRYSALELKNAHDYIYTLDYNLKHGATDYGFDLFYASFS